MEAIFHFFNIKTTKNSEIYDALTQAEGLKNWWSKATDVEEKVGAVIKFWFPNNFRFEMKILSLEKDKVVEWECIHGDDQWLGTKIRFELHPKDDSTDIKFYHTGWVDKTDLFGICNYHWGLYMKSLKSFIEDGKGNPNTVYS